MFQFQFYCDFSCLLSVNINVTVFSIFIAFSPDIFLHECSSISQYKYGKLVEQ